MFCSDLTGQPSNAAPPSMNTFLGLGFDAIDNRHVGKRDGNIPAQNYIAPSNNHGGIFFL